MDYKRFNDKLAIKLKRGEKIVETVRLILERENIKAGFITGIGAANELQISVYDGKEYQDNNFNENMEITNLNGNISTFDGKLYTHFHITAGRADGRAIAGHLKEGIVSMTAEIFVTIIDGTIERYYDDETGLNLMKFE